MRGHYSEKLCPCLLLLAVSLPALILRLGTYPATWFDEGYFTHVARSLAKRGIYGTYTTSADVPFDLTISTGPPTIVPVALSFALFGEGLHQARIVIVLYTLLALGISTPFLLISMDTMPRYLLS